MKIEELNNEKLVIEIYKLIQEISNIKAYVKSIESQLKSTETKDLRRNYNISSSHLRSREAILEDLKKAAKARGIGMRITSGDTAHISGLRKKDKQPNTQKCGACKDCGCVVIDQ